MGSSEVEFKTQLNGAGDVISVDLSKGSGVHVCNDRVRTAVVECIESFQPKLRGGSFAEPYVLEQ
jgi:hypothetical protein